jgi:hypothetical protein
MKNTAAILLALMAGCAAPKASVPARTEDPRGAADAFWVEREYRPQPTGAELVSVHYDHPPRDYYAIWWKRGYYGGYRGYNCGPRYYRRRCD